MPTWIIRLLSRSTERWLIRVKRRHSTQILNRFSGQRELGLQRFIAEAQNLVRFKHSNIVRVMSVFEANETAYMFMEFEEGDRSSRASERSRKHH